MWQRIYMALADRSQSRNGEIILMAPNDGFKEALADVLFGIEKICGDDIR